MRLVLMYDVYPCILMSVINFYYLQLDYQEMEKIKSLWGKINKTVDGWDTPESAKDAVNMLLSNFGFKITGRKGNKAPKFPAKKAGSNCKNYIQEDQERWLQMR